MERKKTVVDLQQLDILEQKIVKATELIRALRREKEAARGKLHEAQEALAQAHSRSAASEKERLALNEATEQLELLKEERVEIRGKVSRMLDMMASLEEASAESQRDH